MISKIILILLNFFDFFHKKKIIKFFNQNQIKSFNLILDIGAHKGESISFFLKNFEVKKIISFEPSFLNFEILNKNLIKLNSQFPYSKIILENFGIGEKKEKKNLKQHFESSSSTLNDFNENSEYFKKKNTLLNIKKNIFKEIEVSIISLEEYIKEKKIDKIDLIKIDTEGYELEVLKGLKDKLNIVKFLIFEHHYDDMLNKGYTFRDVNILLKNYNFKKIRKFKMPFRKSFEYIYINTNYN